MWVRHTPQPQLTTERQYTLRVGANQRSGIRVVVQSFQLQSFLSFLLLRSLCLHLHWP